jgi:hypothetical protein
MLFSIQLGGNALCGGIDVDIRPPMRWEEMLSCQLVILAKYEKHEGNSLSLRVVKVLKGKGIKEGDVVPVSLEHRYSVETGPAGEDAMRKDAKADGIPKLCYKQQRDNSDSLVPVKIVSDVREPNIYFLPNAVDRALTLRGQVQPAEQVDGWQQALDGKRMSLIFRLAQNINPTLARDALEELYKTRDAQTLQQLFDWVLNPPQGCGFSNLSYFTPEMMLASIGDHNGDVYDPLIKLFKEEAEGTATYRLTTIAEIVAQVAPERALGDFSEILAKGPRSLKEHALHGIGYTGNEKAIDLLIDLLKDPDLSDAAFASLGMLLGTDIRQITLYTGPNVVFQEDVVTYTRPVWISAAHQGRLIEVAIPKLRAALASSVIPVSCKEELRRRFGHVFSERPVIDFAHAEKVLLNPDEWVRGKNASKEWNNLLMEIKRSSDPKFIPLLVRILRTVPEAQESYRQSFNDALLHFAAICPNAVRKEILQQGMRWGFGEDSTVAGSITVRLFALLGIPRTLEQLKELLNSCGACVWLKKNTAPADLARQFKEYLQSCISQGSSFPLQHMESLFLIAPEEARNLLEQALAKRDKFDAHTKCEILSLGVKYGKKELVEELIETVRLSFEEDRQKGEYPSTVEFLLMAENKHACAEFRKILDSTRRLIRSRFCNDEYLDSTYTDLLQKLFPSHPGDYFERVLSLLESNSVVERCEGERALESALHSDFSYNYSAQYSSGGRRVTTYMPATPFAPQRAQMLERVRPLLKKLSLMTEVEIRGYLLKEFGVKLEGNANRAWLPALTKAALSYDTAVWKNAAWLIEEITGEYGCFGLAYTAVEREWAFSAYLHDRGPANTEPEQPSQTKEK